MFINREAKKDSQEERVLSPISGYDKMTIALAVGCFVQIFIFRFVNAIAITSETGEIFYLIRYFEYVAMTLVAGGTLLFWLNIKRSLYASWIIYTTVIILCGITYIVENISGWIYLGNFTLYLPAVFSLMLFPMCFIAGKEEINNRGYKLIVALFFGIVPFALALEVFSLDHILILLLVALMLSFKLWSDGKFSFGPFLCWAAFAAIGIPLGIYYGIHIGYFGSGSGDDATILDKIFSSIRLWGLGTNFVQDGISEIEFLYQNGFMGILTAWNCGWIVFCFLILCISGIVFALYKMASSAENSYLKYFCFSAATFFLFRFLFSICYEFFWKKVNGPFPFLGGWTSTVADAIILFSAISMYLRPGDSTVAKSFNDFDEKWNHLRKKIYLLVTGYFVNTAELTDQAGEKHHFIVLKYISYKNKEYVILTQPDWAGNEIEILELDDTGDEEVYSEVRDSKILNEVLAMCNEQSSETYFLSSHISLDNERESDRAKNPEKKETGYAFISYSTKNQLTADAIRELLKGRGINTWMAPGDIPAGSKYAQVINQAVKGCACFILLLTDDSQNSVWVAKETERAINYRKPIIPVQFEDVVLNDEFELYISTDQIVAVQKIDQSSEGVKNFLSAVITHTEKNV